MSLVWPPKVGVDRARKVMLSKRRRKQDIASFQDQLTTPRAGRCRHHVGKPRRRRTWGLDPSAGTVGIKNIESVFSSGRFRRASPPPPPFNAWVSESRPDGDRKKNESSKFVRLPSCQLGGLTYYGKCVFDIVSNNPVQTLVSKTTSPPFPPPFNVDVIAGDGFSDLSS